MQARTLSLTDEYLLRGLVSIILVSGMAIWGPTSKAAAAAAAAAAPMPCLELGRPNAAAGVCGRFREGFGGGVVGSGPAAAAANGQATSIMAAAAASMAEVCEVAVEGAPGRERADPAAAAAAEDADVAEVAEAEGIRPPPPPWCPATGMLGSDTCARVTRVGGEH